jgi:hypothetical protein
VSGDALKFATPGISIKHISHQTKNIWKQSDPLEALITTKLQEN